MFRVVVDSPHVENFVARSGGEQCRVRTPRARPNYACVTARVFVAFVENFKICMGGI